MFVGTDWVTYQGSADVKCDDWQQDVNSTDANYHKHLHFNKYYTYLYQVLYHMYRYCTERSMVLFFAAASQRCTYDKHLENNIKQLQKVYIWIQLIQMALVILSII